MSAPGRMGAPWPRIAVSAAAAFGVLGLLVLLLSSEAATSAVRRAFAMVTGALLNALGNHTVVRGADILSPEFGISVVTACTGLFIAGLFVAAVVAFPASWRARLVGVGLGLTALFAVNVLRLVSLYYIGRYWPSVFDSAHQLVWQSLLIAIAVLLWLAWAGRAATPRRRPA